MNNNYFRFVIIFCFLYFLDFAFIDAITKLNCEGQLLTEDGNETTCLEEFNLGWFLNSMDATRDSRNAKEHKIANEGKMLILFWS